MDKTLKELGFENLPYIKEKHGVKGNPYKTMPAPKGSKAEFVKLPYRNPKNKLRKLLDNQKDDILPKYIKGK